MNYLLNLSLPLWAMLLPLGIAALLAAKYYQSQSKLQKQKQKHDIAFELQKMKLDELMQQRKELNEAIESRKEIQALAKDIIKDLTEKCHKLESDAVEREALIKQARSNLDAYVFKSNQLDLKVSKWAFELDELDSRVKQLNGEISELKDLNDILYNIVQANSRTRKAYSKYIDSKKPTETPQSETVVHDILGVARVFEADQSESVNNRHTVVNICNEVNRGIAEQAERIRQELEVVNMSQLESGDMVKLRNKENRTVIDVFNNGALGRPFGITINKGTSTVSLFYDKNGHYDCVKHGFDIIQIIKPAKCYKSNKPCEFGCNGLCKDA